MEGSPEQPAQRILLAAAGVAGASVLFPAEIAPLTAHQERRLVYIISELTARERLQRERQGNGVIVRTSSIFPHPEGERAGPTPPVAIERVELLFHPAIPGFEPVRSAESPIFVQAQVKAADDQVISYINVG